MKTIFNFEYRRKICHDRMKPKTKSYAKTAKSSTATAIQNWGSNETGILRSASLAIFNWYNDIGKSLKNMKHGFLLMMQKTSLKRKTSTDRLEILDTVICVQVNHISVMKKMEATSRTTTIYQGHGEIVLLGSTSWWWMSLHIRFSLRGWEKESVG